MELSSWLFYGGLGVVGLVAIVVIWLLSRKPPEPPYQKRIQSGAPDDSPTRSEMRT